MGPEIDQKVVQKGQKVVKKWSFLVILGHFWTPYFPPSVNTQIFRYPFGYIIDRSWNDQKMTKKWRKNDEKTLFFCVKKWVKNGSFFDLIIFGIKGGFGYI